MTDSEKEAFEKLLSMRHIPVDISKVTDKIELEWFVYHLNKRTEKEKNIFFSRSDKDKND